MHTTATFPTSTAGPGDETSRFALMRDGNKVFYRVWEPEQVHAPAATKAAVLFHRGHEHSGRLSELAWALTHEGFRVFAWDQRGHGRTPGKRGFANSFGAIVKDADDFVRHICDEHGMEIGDIAVIGHSVGAVVAAAWVHDYAPPIRALVLVTPAFRINLYVPFAIPGLRLLDRVRKPAFIKSYVRSGMLTHDAGQAASYDADELICRDISVNVLLGVHDASTRLIDDAAAIRTSTLLLSAHSDWVVSLPAQKRFFDRLGSPIKQMEVLRGFRHAALHETGRQQVFDRINRFLAHSFARPPALAPMEVGATVQPPSCSLLARLGFAVAKTSLATAGHLSKGIALGWSSGFDSGRSLDHVYRNSAQGITPLGRLFDRLYLDTPGWVGIRTRRRNMEALLERAIRETDASGRAVQILDLAAGPGRYVMETMSRLRDLPIRAILRDRDEKGLSEGRAIAAQLGLANVRHEAGDAFDPSSIASAHPRPTIGIVSGLYELFADNTMILRSLHALHDTLQCEGLLLYTNQPWHPQLAFISHVLTNRDGKPWVMRCRPQAEMDSLVAAAGFEKIAMETDEQAIFTVSLARKRSAA